LLTAANIFELPKKTLSLSREVCLTARKSLISHSLSHTHVCTSKAKHAMLKVSDNGIVATIQGYSKVGHVTQAHLNTRNNIVCSIG
jgi:hypothetical protein